MIKVLLDARKINDGGIGTYIRNLVSAFHSSTDCSFTLIVSGTQSSIGSDVRQIVDTSKSYSLDEYLFFASRINTAGYDLYHSPHFTLPYFIKCPSVVTIHDTIHLSAPEKWFYPLIARPLIGSALKRASKVIAVSQAGREEIIRHFGHSHKLEHKLEVVNNAISADFFKHTGNQPEAEIELPKDFWLSVISQNKPHKGLSDLLKAYANVKNKHQHLPQLLLAGYGVADYVSSNSLLVSEYQKLGVVFLGKVSQQQLNTLYLRARALLMVSRIEGFGLTVLEAKALSCPVLSRPLPSVVEMLSDQDIVTHDMSQDALEQALLNAATRFTEASSRKVNAAITERYSLQNLADKTLSLYRQALKK